MNTRLKTENQPKIISSSLIGEYYNVTKILCLQSLPDNMDQHMGSVTKSLIFLGGELRISSNLQSHLGEKWCLTYHFFNI